MTSISPRSLALVAGADQPFGHAIVQALVHAGHDVLAASATPQGEAPAPSGAVTWLTLEAPADTAALAQALPGDVADRLAVLVINAPVAQADVRFADIGDADFVQTLQRQLLEPAAWVRACLPWLGARAGRIVHVGSRGAQGAWGGAHDMAGSAGIIGLVRSLALEFAGQGVRANSVAADFVPALAAGSSDAGEIPHAPAVARAVTYLAEPGDGPSGHTILIDGLRSLRLSEARRR